MRVKKPSKIAWNEIDKVGYPPAEMTKYDYDRDRQFLVRLEYSIEVAYLFRDRSGFDLPDHCVDIPIAWAVIEGF